MKFGIKSNAPGPEQQKLHEILGLYVPGSSQLVIQTRIDFRLKEGEHYRKVFEEQCLAYEDKGALVIRRLDNPEEAVFTEPIQSLSFRLVGFDLDIFSAQAKFEIESIQDLSLTRIDQFTEPQKVKREELAAKLTALGVQDLSSK